MSTDENEQRHREPIGAATQPEPIAEFLRRVCREAAENPAYQRAGEDAEREDDRRLRAQQLSSIPPAFRGLRLGGHELAACVASGAALAQARAAVEAMLVAGRGGDHGRVVLVGPAGCGKTSLAAAMLRAWTEKRSAAARAGYFITAARLALARQAHPLGSGEAPDVWQALSTPLLVIDELGSEASVATSALCEVIHERHAQCRPTWITTGACDPGEDGVVRYGVKHVAESIAKRYGDGICRRIFERATIIDCAARSKGR